tara:strand:+ start:3141 stop:3491 length:351 start_codon:yes stop_codon:yes gene_type:complete
MAFTGYIGYKINNKIDVQLSSVKSALSFEPNIISKSDKDYRENVFKALGSLMAGQAQLTSNQAIISIGQLRLHHFIEPHSDSFYPNCPECQKEKREIIKDENRDEKSAHAKYDNGI